jgi:hypothetical protein
VATHDCFQFLGLLLRVLDHILHKEGD